jgi:tellurite resistance protein TerC
MLGLYLLAASDDAAAPMPWIYAGFVLLIVGLLALDLGVFRREVRTIGMREALAWTGVWVSLALLFSVAIWFLYDAHAFGLGLEVPVLGHPGLSQTLTAWDAWKLFVTGYIVEESLSLDNVFVIAVVFASLRIPAEFQHRVLFWGILGAIVLRGLMIVLGYELVRQFAWITYAFGGLLVVTGLRMALIRHDATDPGASLAVRIARRLLPVADRYDGHRFTVRIDGKRYATPLLLALVLVEMTDVVFAVDSIPAIFAITTDPFLVFTSNVFAILGLRSLYFCLAALLGTLRWLKPALIAVLIFVGVKMCLVHTPFAIPIDAALMVILGLLGTGIVASLVWPRPDPRGQAPGAS